MTPSNAVVLLELFRGDQPLATGTGVLYRKGAATFVVTAWHNVTGRHSDTLTPLSGGLPDRGRLHIAKTLIGPDGKGVMSIRQAVDLPLEDEVRTYYLVHPQGYPRVDVVAIPIDPDQVHSGKALSSDGTIVTLKMPLQQAPTNDGLGCRIECIQDFAGVSGTLGVDFTSHLDVTDETFVVGYPKGLTDQNLQPIWKRATVATQPRLGWQGQRKFLIDCASREGLSGAPVLTYDTTGKMRAGGMTFVGTGPSTILHGIYVSRLGGSREFEAQIGTVWSCKVIDEIIDAGIWGLRSDEQEASNVELREFIRERWPSAKGDDYADAVTNGGRPSGHFSHKIALEINGRAGFERIDRMVREEAKALCERSGPAG